MKKSKSYAYALLLVIFTSSMINADIADGESFLIYIKGSDHENINSISGFYDGYINGVADSAMTMSWCPPDSFNRNQLLRIISKYYKANPTKANQVNMPAKDLIIQALKDAYPCQ